MNNTRLTATFLIATLLSAPALAKPHDKEEKVHGNPHAAQAHGMPSHDRDDNARHDDEYTRQHDGGEIFGRDASLNEVLQAGLSAALLRERLGDRSTLRVGARPLPPGIAKNLARGKPLPPGIAKQGVPDPLLRQLPRVNGYDWVRLGTELVLVGAASQVIEQVISGVFD